MKKAKIWERVFFVGAGGGESSQKITASKEGGACEKNWQAEGGHAIFKW